MTGKATNFIVRKQTILEDVPCFAVAAVYGGEQKGCPSSQQCLPARLDRVLQHARIKPERPVPLRAGLHIGGAGKARPAVLVHDVDERTAPAHLACADIPDGQGQLLFVVQAGIR